MLKSKDIEGIDFIKRVKHAHMASGYIVNENYYDKLIELYEVAVPLLEQTGSHHLYANDSVWKDFQETDKWYYFTKRLGNQRNGWSDNSNSYVNFDIFSV